jgi:hypothetical protein
LAALAKVHSHNKILTAAKTKKRKRTENAPISRFFSKLLEQRDSSINLVFRWCTFDMQGQHSRSYLTARRPRQYVIDLWRTNFMCFVIKAFSILDFLKNIVPCETAPLRKLAPSILSCSFGAEENVP